LGPVLGLAPPGGTPGRAVVSAAAGKPSAQMKGGLNNAYGIVMDKKRIAAAGSFAAAAI